jgi:hypothetical protein
MTVSYRSIVNFSMACVLYLAPPELALPVFLRSTGTLWSTQAGVPVGIGTSFKLDFIGVQGMEVQYMNYAELYPVNTVSL